MGEGIFYFIYSFWVTKHLEKEIGLFWEREGAKKGEQDKEEEQIGHYPSFC